MQGGTFTITNGGVYGSLMSTPILNAPQSGILGMHKIQERPMAIAGKIEIRPMMYLALSYDHRIVDGREAVTFLVRVKEVLGGSVAAGAGFVIQIGRPSASANSSSLGRNEVAPTALSSSGRSMAAALRVLSSRIIALTGPSAEAVTENDR